MPRRLLQVTAGVFVGGCANQMHVEQVFNPDRKETIWAAQAEARLTVFDTRKQLRNGQRLDALK
jgi:hypothetical protein